MKLWKNLSNRLDAVADVMAAKPCMQGCVGKTLLSIPRTPGNLITAVILAIGLLITIGRFGFGLGAVTNLDDNNPGASGSPLTCCAASHWRRAAM